MATNSQPVPSQYERVTAARGELNEAQKRFDASREAIETIAAAEGLKDLPASDPRSEPLWSAQRDLMRAQANLRRAVQQRLPRGWRGSSPGDVESLGQLRNYIRYALSLTRVPSNPAGKLLPLADVLFNVDKALVEWEVANCPEVSPEPRSDDEAHRALLRKLHWLNSVVEQTDHGQDDRYEQEPAVASRDVDGIKMGNTDGENLNPAEGENLSPQARAMAFIVDNPDATIKQVAESVGVLRQTLYKPSWEAVLRAIRFAQYRELPNGEKSADGMVEGSYCD